MAKNSEEMTNDILNSLRMKNAPESVILEAYLDVMIKQHRKEAVEEYIAEQKNKQNVEYKPGY